MLKKILFRESKLQGWELHSFWGLKMSENLVGIVDENFHMQLPLNFYPSLPFQNKLIFSYLP